VSSRKIETERPLNHPLTPSRSNIVYNTRWPLAQTSRYESVSSSIIPWVRAIVTGKSCRSCRAWPSLLESESESSTHPTERELRTYMRGDTSSTTSSSSSHLIWYTNMRPRCCWTLQPRTPKARWDQPFSKHWESSHLVEDFQNLLHFLRILSSFSSTPSSRFSLPVSFDYVSINELDFSSSVMDMLYPDNKVTCRIYWLSRYVRPGTFFGGELSLSSLAWRRVLKLSSVWRPNCTDSAWCNRLTKRSYVILFSAIYVFLIWYSMSAH